MLLLHKACPAASLLRSAVHHRTAPAVSRLPELLPAVRGLYPRRRLAYLPGRLSHKPDSPTRPTSTPAASDLPQDLPRPPKATRPLLRPGFNLLHKVLPVLPVLLLQASCLPLASSRLLGSVGDHTLLSTNITQGLSVLHNILSSEL